MAEKFYKGFGVKVVMKFVSGAFKGRSQTLHNITEIHKNFESPLDKVLGQRTAFESDIHQQGVVYPNKEFKIVSITKETKKVNR
jgi:hypothetical protein